MGFGAVEKCDTAAVWIGASLVIRLYPADPRVYIPSVIFVSWGMSQANMDLGILQETKLTDGIYTHGSAGYSVIATDAPSRHRGGVTLFYRSEPHFVVEAVEKFGPNVLGFQLATGARRWYIVGGVHRARGNGDDGEGGGGNPDIDCRTL